MKYLDLTLTTPAGNLALEEALLEACEAGSGPEVLRVWTPARRFVVVGYANRVAAEVRRETCEAEGIPILRRTTGGGAVVQAAGVLCYAVVFRVARDPETATISGTNRCVLDRVAAALQSALGQELHPPHEAGNVSILGTDPFGAAIARDGDTDLVWRGRKCAGNSQRRLREAVLFHGCILAGMDLGLMERFLSKPSREPAYRAGRTHGEFVVNLPVPIPALKHALRMAWNALEILEALPLERAEELVRAKYGREDWNLRS